MGVRPRWEEKEDKELIPVIFSDPSIEPTGLVGFLKLAKLTGKIGSLQDCLDRLIENNYRISKKIYNEVLIGVGELSRNEDK